MTYQNSAPACPDWCANPPGDRRECGRPPTCSELACCGRPPPRVVIVLCSAPSSSRYRGANSGFGTLLESLSRCQPVLESLSWFDVVLESLPWFDVLLVSLSWYKPWVQQTGLVCPTHTPVTIVVQTLVRRPPRVAIVVPTPPRVVIVVPTPPRVTIAVPTRGSALSVANGCVCFSPYCKDSGFRLGSRTGGKVTCRNSRTARNRGFVAVFARSKPVNPVPYCGLKRRNP